MISFIAILNSDVKLSAETTHIVVEICVVMMSLCMVALIASIYLSIRARIIAKTAILLLRLSYMKDVKDTINAAINDIKPTYTHEELSNICQDYHTLLYKKFWVWHPEKMCTDKKMYRYIMGGLSREELDFAIKLKEATSEEFYLAVRKLYKLDYLFSGGSSCSESPAPLH